MEENEKKICAILGPTATGKSDFSIWLAEKIGGEIISADSMQIYKEMDIATAKISKKHREKIPHHMIDLLEVDEEFSVAEYVEMTKKIIDNIIKKNKKPIVVGGSGLYIDCLLDEVYFEKNTFNKQLREKLENELKINGKEYMFLKLKQLNPIQAKNIHINNTKRIIRTIERNYLKNDNLNLNAKKKSFKTLKIGFNYENRENLYEKINLRVDKMIEKGLLEEAKKILSKKCSKTAFQAIGYKELKPFFMGDLTLKDAVLNLKQNSRRYAKRQLTWFKRDTSIHWFFLDKENKDLIKKKVLNLVKKFYN